MNFPLLYFTAVIFSSALTSMGLGGGTLLILFFSFFSSFSQTQMQSLNLFLFLPAAALSLYFHHKNGLLDFSSVKKLLPFSILGAVLGSLLSNRLNPELLRKCFALFLLVIGLRELVSSLKLIKQKFSASKH